VETLTLTKSTFIDRHSLVLASVTLDGKPARVTGIRNDYALVMALRGETSAEFAWSTVASVVTQGGNFKS
jgi:hypothetical protein